MTDITCAVGSKTMVKMRVFFLHESQYIFCLVGGSVIDYNDFELGIVLFQNGRKGLTQIVGFVACAKNDGKGR